MTPIDFSGMDCSVARTLDVVGDRWTLLILRDAFYGVRRFDDFASDLGVARNVLTDRLNKLVDRDVLEKVLYEEKPPRFEYMLTKKGRALLPVLLTLMQWGDRWESDEAPVTVTHVPCGHEASPVLTCGHCGERLSGKDLSVHPLPMVASPTAAELS